jgi:aminopeptidase N
LSEPYQSHTWFPCKQDLADKADSAWIFLTVANNLKAGSNGLLTGQTPIGNDKTRYEWKTHYPVTYYLISFSVADYIDYTFYVNIPGTNHNMPVQNYLYNHPLILQAEKEKIDKTKDILLLYSELLGTYPFYLEKYGHCLAPMGGGMEHQTMTTLTHFNFGLVAHELAHQWFGNYVTCKTWQDIWINEGFASYLEYVAIEKLRTEEETKAWLAQAHSSSILYPEGSVFIDEEDVRKVDRIFNMELSYKKGAVILHMLRFELADDSLFFSILKGFLSEYASGVASGNDFIKYVNQITGKDYTWFLNQWYYGKGYPMFFTTWTQAQDSLIINSIQEGSSAETPFFRTHMDYKLVFEDGSQERIRVNYLKNEERFAVFTGKTINYIAADPENALLKSSVVVKQMNANQLFEVNPNPFTDTLNIRFKNPGEKRKIRLSSLSGKINFESDSANEFISEDMSSLKPGIYILTVTEGMIDFSVKLVKTNPKKL